MISEKEFMILWEKSEKGLIRQSQKLTFFNIEEAEDLLHDAFINAFSKRDKYNTETSFNTWAYNVLKNKFIDGYRKNKPRYNILNTHEEEQIDFSVSICSINSVDKKMFLEDFNSAVDKLESRIKTPFKMHTEGYKYREISKICKIPEGTIKARIHLARKILQKTLFDYRPERFVLKNEEVFLVEETTAE